MARFRIEHPSRENVYAMAGHDHMLGFFVETFHENREKPLKVCDFFTIGRAVTLQECFDFLISENFFTTEDLQDVLICRQDGTRVPKRLERVARVVGEFKGL